MRSSGDGRVHGGMVSNVDNAARGYSSSPLSMTADNNHVVTYFTPSRTGLRRWGSSGQSNARSENRKLVYAPAIAHLNIHVDP